MPGSDEHAHGVAHDYKGVLVDHGPDLAHEATTVAIQQVATGRDLEMCSAFGGFGVFAHQPLTPVSTTNAAGCATATSARTQQRNAICPVSLNRSRNTSTV